MAPLQTLFSRKIGSPWDDDDNLEFYAYAHTPSNFSGGQLRRNLEGCACKKEFSLKKKRTSWTGWPNKFWLKRVKIGQNWLFWTFLGPILDNYLDIGHASCASCHSVYFTWCCCSNSWTGHGTLWFCNNALRVHVLFTWRSFLNIWAGHSTY